MKKFILGILILAIVTGIYLVVYPPQKISNGCGMAPCMYFYKCHGFYLQTFDDRSGDGGVGGICFGKIEELKNENYKEIMEWFGIIVP